MPNQGMWRCNQVTYQSQCSTQSVTISFMSFADYCRSIPELGGGKLGDERSQVHAVLELFQEIDYAKWPPPSASAIAQKCSEQSASIRFQTKINTIMKEDHF